MSFSVRLGMPVVLGLLISCIAPDPGVTRSELEYSTPPSSNVTPDRTRRNVNQDVLVIQGIFDPSGEKLLELAPLQRYTRQLQPNSNPQEGPFVVEVGYVNGEVILVPFNALIADDSSPGATRYGFFEVTVPVSGEIRAVRITDSSGQHIYGEVDATELRP